MGRWWCWLGWHDPVDFWSHPNHATTFVICRRGGCLWMREVRQ